VRDAAEQGARIVVTPEVGLRVTDEQRESVMRQLSELASDANVTLVAGYFDQTRSVNQAVIFLPDGTLVGEYRKTHLIPSMEDYNPGDGTLLVARTDIGQIGVMICQDDNFTDLSRGYGRRGISLLAVPTNDWLEVREFHLQNTTLRAVGSGFALVRGATNGVSAIIDSKGRVLARRDHFDEGTGIVSAELELQPASTLFARAGNWFPICCLGILVVLSVFAWRRRKKG